MKIKTFDTIDYRGDSVKVKELNFMIWKWNLRLVIPKIGVSLWKNHEQRFRANYPSC